MLRLGTGAAAGALGAYAMDRLASRAPPAGDAGGDDRHRDSIGAAPAAGPPAAPAPTMVTGSFVSAARGGVPTNWAIARPPGQTKPLRPVIALHGKGSSAATVMDGGVEQGLAQAVGAGLPPFAVVAVDGGGSYWHKRASGEDSGAMVLNELIPMLASSGSRYLPGRVSWLVDGRLRRIIARRSAWPARTAAICAVSPALWMSSGAAAPGAFDGPDDWSANSVFGMPALASIPIRVDCGTSDPFYGATKQFVAQLPNPPAGGFPPAATTHRSGARNCPPN